MGADAHPVDDPVVTGQLADGAPGGHVPQAHLPVAAAGGEPAHRVHTGMATG